MLTYTNALALYKKLTRNQNSDNVIIGALNMNLGARKICNSFPWKFLEDSKTFNTVANVQFYNIAHNLKTILNVYVTIDTQKYTPDRIADRKTWDILNSSTTPTSNYPTKYFPFAKQIGFFPKFSTSDFVVTVLYKKRIIDLSIEDYIEGTITVANNSKTIIGSGTTFEASMIGRYIQMPDKEWYEIDEYVSATEITLKDTYDGLNISGESYIIGEAYPIDEDYQELPVYWAVFMYWSTIGNDDAKAGIYKSLFVEGLEEMKNELKSLVSDPVLNEGIGSDIIKNPNLYPTNIT